MYELVLEATKAILLSNAITTELATVEAQFEQASPIQFVDVNGHTVTVNIQAPIDIEPFVEGFIGEPPLSLAGRYPKFYVYHLGSEYPADLQEGQIRTGLHRFGLTLFTSGVKPEVAEQQGGRMAWACIKLLERNQYVYGQLPGALGYSTLTFAENVVTTQHVAATVVPVHMIFIARIREVRA